MSVAITTRGKPPTGRRGRPPGSKNKPKTGNPMGRTKKGGHKRPQHTTLEYYKQAARDPLKQEYRSRATSAIWITDTRTVLPGVSCFAVQMSSPVSMGRPSKVLLKWPRHSTPINEAVEQGYLKASGDGPNPKPPHFGIGQGGELVQFLDPTRSGSAMGRGALADICGQSTTIVIVALQPRSAGRMPTVAQVRTAERLAAVLKRIYGLRDGFIVEDLEWKEARRVVRDNPGIAEE